MNRSAPSVPPLQLKLLATFSWVEQEWLSQLIKGPFGPFELSHGIKNLGFWVLFEVSSGGELLQARSVKKDWRLQGEISYRRVTMRWLNGWKRWEWKSRSASAQDAISSPLQSLMGVSWRLGSGKNDLILGSKSKKKSFFQRKDEAIGLISFCWGRSRKQLRTRPYSLYDSLSSSFPSSKVWK